MSCSLGHHCSSISVSQRTMELATQEEPAQWVWAETGTFPKCVSAILWLGQPSPNRPPPSPTFFSPQIKQSMLPLLGLILRQNPTYQRQLLTPAALYPPGQPCLVLVFTLVFVPPGHVLFSLLTSHTRLWTHWLLSDITLPWSFVNSSSFLSHFFWSWLIDNNL